MQVIRFNPETQRISLGMKQLEADPWEGVDAKYPVGPRFTGRVTNITDYGAFVELEPGIEGLVHVSEMSWTKKNVHPGKIVSTSQEVELQSSMSIRTSVASAWAQADHGNPWDIFLAASRSVPRSKASQEHHRIRSVRRSAGDIDGMVHMSDIDWQQQGEEAIKHYNKGDIVKAKILEVDVNKERISLGIKQLSDDPFEGTANDVKKGEVVTCTVSKIVDNGIEVTVNEVMQGFIRRSDLSRDRSEQRPDRYAVGDKIDARITAIDASAAS